jgi:hypothetical protein
MTAAAMHTNFFVLAYSGNSNSFLLPVLRRRLPHAQLKGWNVPCWAVALPFWLAKSWSHQKHAHRVAVTKAGGEGQHKQSNPALQCVL